MILKIVLLLLAIDTLLRVIFNVKNTTLNCGIFAWAGKNPKKFNKGKFDVLGIFNEKRGVDSCGISIDGEIYTGTYKNKVYKDFISNVGYDLPKQLPAVLGHTRWATGGSHNEHNAHPFGFGNHKGMFEFIGIHNGSLLNELQFSKKRNIDEKIQYSADNGVTRYRNKIDSELLLEAIYKDKNFSVLSEYQGAAALIFTNVKEPNVVYFYHGLSKKYPNDKKLEEERPLHYYTETKNSLYVSSMPESLYAIGGNDKTIGEFKHNTVYKITDGDISKAKLYKINRENNYQKYYPTGYGGYHISNAYDVYDLEDDLNCNFNLPSKQNAKVSNVINIYHENTGSKEYGGKVYFAKLRYFRTGHLINGCYTWIKNYGFYYLGETIKEAEKTFWSFVNKPFFDGVFIENNDKDIAEAYIPLVHNKENEITDVPLLYFFEGIRLIDSLDYAACINRKNQGNSFDYDQLSMCAAHPIINIDKNYKEPSKQGILLKSELYNGNISPLGSDKIYDIKEGNLVGIKSKVKKKLTQKETLKVISLKEAFDDVESKADNRIEDSNVEDLIEEIFGDFYQKVSLNVKSLKKYKNHDRAIKAIDLLEFFKEYISELLILEKQES